MSRQLVFHIGDCKTGSTSIQWALDHDLVQPHTATLLFPGQRSHLALARSLGRKADPEIAEKRFAALRQRLDGSRWDVAVISSELFEFSDPARLNKMIQTHLAGSYDRLHIIAYIRPHADRLLAQYMEAVKLGQHQGSLSQFHQNFNTSNGLNYASRLKKWHDIFGPALQVRPFMRSALSKGDVVRDFFDLVLGKDTYDCAPVPAQNSRLYVEDLAAFNLLHQMIRDLPQQPPLPMARYSAWLAEVLPSLSDENGHAGTELALPQAIATTLKVQCAEDAQLTDQGFLGGDYLTPALQRCANKAIPNEQSLAPTDVLPPMTIRFLRASFALQIAQMLRDKSFFQRQAWAADIVASTLAPVPSDT